MRAHKLAALFLAAVLMVLPPAPAYADEQVTAKGLDKNVDLTQAMFEDKRTVPLWLLKDLKQFPNKTISLETKEERDNYKVSFTGSKIYELQVLPRYDLTVKRVLDEKVMKDYYNAASLSTPKYLLELPQEGSWGCEAEITMLKSNFMPSSTVHVYRYKGDNVYTPIAKNVPVDEDGNFTFPVIQGGTYLVTAREISKKLDGTLSFSRPSLHEVDGLLSYLNEDSLYDFSEMIENRKNA